MAEQCVDEAIASTDARPRRAVRWEAGTTRWTAAGSPSGAAATGSSGTPADCNNEAHGSFPLSRRDRRWRAGGTRPGWSPRSSGAEVTIVDTDGLGGSAVLTDCVPSKTLIATAELMTDV